MPSRVALTSLNARTIDIINTIRANASPQYQHLVPEIEKETDIPAVGQTLLGYPQMANEFISTLVNRIASVEVKSAIFNNPYADLKKGFLELGETVEEVFVSIAKAREFNVEKAPAREFKRSLPDVRTAFHPMNWKVQYPVTIQRNDLERAFLSVSGVTDMITRIVDTLYNGANYDEYLLFKYLLIKAISSGKAKPIVVDSTDAKDFGIKARGTSSELTFMSSSYNYAGVTTVTDKKDQYIFIDAKWEAQYDVEVLASAFNMDKADYLGKRKLIDNWNTFDNDRFSIIRENSTMIDEVTDDELSLMNDVRAVLVDGEWFQVYDNLSEFSEKFVASGLYWNYFYNVWKTVSFSPFSNMVVFVSDNATITPPASIKYNVTAVSSSDNATIVTLELDDSTASLSHASYIFVQTEDATTDGVAVHKYGAIILPEGKDYDAVLSVDGTLYEGDVAIDSSTVVGDVITFTPSV